MADRSLSAEERALWHRLAATVNPIRRGQSIGGKGVPSRPSIAAADLATAMPGRQPPTPPAPLRPIAPTRKPAQPSDTLDGGWDRRLRRGAISPDRAIDLHGHTLATAQAALDTALADALAAGSRVLLVVTGKPPRAGEGRRGLIRASIFDWLAMSRHAARIAAVRNAHPKHGGAGALYLILRRTRGE